MTGENFDAQHFLNSLISPLQHADLSLLQALDKAAEQLFDVIMNDGKLWLIASEKLSSIAELFIRTLSEPDSLAGSVPFPAVALQYYGNDRLSSLLREQDALVIFSDETEGGALLEAAFNALNVNAQVVLVTNHSDEASLLPAKSLSLISLENSLVNNLENNQLAHSILSHTGVAMTLSLKLRQLFFGH